MVKLDMDNKRVFESQAKIYKGLRRLLRSKQLSDITIQELKDECRVSRSTFYRNFNNVTDVLEIMLDYFYNRYLEESKDKKNQSNKLLFFFQYWYYHRDLIHIVAHQRKVLLEDCIKRHEKNYSNNVYLIDLKYSILTSLLCRWSESKKETPEEMEQLTKELLDKRCLDLL